MRMPAPTLRRDDRPPQLRDRQARLIGARACGCKGGEGRLDRRRPRAPEQFAGEPRRVEARGDAARQRDARQRAGGDALGVEDPGLGAPVGGIGRDRDRVAAVLVAALRALRERRLAREPAGGIVVDLARALVVVVLDQALRTPGSAGRSGSAGGRSSASCTPYSVVSGRQNSTFRSSICCSLFSPVTTFMRQRRRWPL